LFNGVSIYMLLFYPSMSTISTASEKEQRGSTFTASSGMANEETFPPNFPFYNPNDDSSFEVLYSNDALSNNSNVEEERETRPRPVPSRLWRKGDVNYHLDPGFEDRIWERFQQNIAVLRERKHYERGGIYDDAFYSRYRAVPISSTDALEESRELLERLGCRRLRTTSLELIDYVKELTREFEEFVAMQENEEELRMLLCESAGIKRRTAYLVNEVRNCIGEVILSGEECRNHICMAKKLAYRSLRLFSEGYFEDERSATEEEEESE
jgi:hypothetical protein